MKIKFKEQKFQLEAVQAVVDCFKGQINETSKFTLDRGRTKADLKGQTFFLYEEGFKNKSISFDQKSDIENITILVKASKKFNCEMV
ncbi:MAG: hypothetical protein ACFWUA_01110 [Sporanaerobacter sp.]|uniref:hypothetical protein n=1 Tax=Sporanaerobacter sp. TaxID=2010183 RepID=UPI003A0FD685